MRFGDNLRKLRKMKKLSQEQLAEKMNVSRQSISKWETGDAYPEMNNILELCKIFHCHINDLVNDSIIDVDSLDDETKMKVIKFKKEQQAKMKGLSKAISVIARIGRIVVIVCIPIIVLAMIVFGLAVGNFEVLDGEIRYNGKDTNVVIVEDDDSLSVEIDGVKLAETTNVNEITKIKKMLVNNSKYVILGYGEFGLAFLVVCLVLMIVMLKALENLFNNINRGDTPFTLENVRYIKKMAYLMIAITILPNVVGAIYGMFLRMDLDIDLELFSLVEILFLFSIAYIFQYGYEIQLDSKGKMYGDGNE